MRQRLWWIGILVVTLGIGLASPAMSDEVMLGGMCDRTGPTKTVAVHLCAGVLDYFKLVDSKGGVDGNKITYKEVEYAYKVDRGVEAYERLKRDGAVAMLDLGTPLVYALTPRHLEDKIPGLTPGFGRADSTDGETFPYIFPMAATYWSQMGAAMEFVKTKGMKKGSKIAYIYYDNPAGREPLEVFKRVCEKEGYTCREFAVPPPGVEMASQILDITRRMKADFVVSHLFGKAPAISMKEFRKSRFPLEKIVSLVWGAGEADMTAAGWDTAQGYLGLHFAGVGRDYSVIKEIIALYEKEGKPVPETVGSVYYNRGILMSALMVEGVRLAIENFGLPVTGEKIKNGWESIKEFNLGGLLPPITVTSNDHEGGGWVQVYQTKGEKLVAHSDWIRGYRDIVHEEVKKAVERYKAGKK